MKFCVKRKGTAKHCTFLKLNLNMCHNLLWPLYKSLHLVIKKSLKNAPVIGKDFTFVTTNILRET
jgi:hypothetical protein